MTNRFPDPRLAAALDAVEQDLDSILDLNAGLRDILLIEQFAAIEQDLDTIVDLHAGLAAILEKPSSIPVLPHNLDNDYALRLTLELRLLLREKTYRGLARALHDFGLLTAPLGVCDMADWIIALKMMMRSSSLTDTIETAFLLLDPDRHEHEDREALVAGFDRWRFLQRFMRRLRSLAATSPTLGHDWNSWAAECDQHEEAFEMRRSVVRALCREIAKHLSMLNDFVDADLRDQALDPADLDGVVWSPSSTLWPTHIYQKIVESSEPHGDGLYIVRTGKLHSTTPA